MPLRPKWGEKQGRPKMAQSNRLMSFHYFERFGGQGGL
jgi:hypothetical protein